MNLGKLCKYAQECPVYLNKNRNIKKPIFLVRNVFCNRGDKGWSNCERFLALEAGEMVNSNTTPYNR